MTRLAFTSPSCRAGFDPVQDLIPRGKHSLKADTPSALGERRSALQVWERKRFAAVATICCSQQREHRLVLHDRQELTLTRRPTFGRKVECEEPDLANKSFHRGLLLSGRAIARSRCAFSSLVHLRPGRVKKFRLAPGKHGSPDDLFKIAR